MTHNHQTDKVVRATELRELGVKYGSRIVERVNSLAYDHQAGQVTGVHLESDGGVQRQVSFDSLDLSKMDQGELRLEPPVLSSALGERQPIDTVMVKLSSGQTAYVQDSLIDPRTGKIVAYELGLQKPGTAGKVVQVLPGEVTFPLHTGLWEVTPAAEARLQ